MQNKTDNEFYDAEEGQWDTRAIADEIEARLDLKCISKDENDDFYVYRNGIWKKEGSTVVEKHCMDITNELIRSGNLNQVETILKNRNRVLGDVEQFEMKDYLIPFENGVYNVKKDHFREYKPEDNLRFKNNVRYIPETGRQYEEQAFQRHEDLDLNEEEGKVEEFLNTLVDTKRKKGILKETAGLALMTNYPIDEAPILYGQGSNGKNMYVELLKKMSGSWHSIDLNEATDDKFAKKEMEGSSFLFFDELGHIKNPQKLKSFVGDEDMRVRPMRDTGYMGKQRAIPVMAANEIPRPPEQTDGFFRRFCIIDFPYKFTNEEDDHKDKKPREEIEEEYFNKAALSLFASKVARSMNKVVENEGFTESYRTEAKRQVWNLKSHVVYSFLDMFVTQGKLPDQSTTESADAVRKDKLLEMVNDYSEIVNGSKVQSHELTTAIDNNPDLETGSDARIELNNGSTKRAYSGIKVTLPSFHDYQVWSDLIGSLEILLLRYSELFDTEQADQVIQGLEITESDVIAKTLKLLRIKEEDTVSLLTVIKALDLSESDIQPIMESKFIQINSKSAEEITYPELSIDSEAFEQAVKESDSLTYEKKEVKSLYQWLRNEIESWSKETKKEFDEVLDKGEELGFDRDKVEEEVEEFIDDRMLFQPQPDKVQKLA